MTETARIKVEDPHQIWAMAEAAGLMAAQKYLEAIPDTLKQTPGMALAIATIAAKANEARAAYVARNMIIIAKSGHDIVRYKTVSFDGNTAELICEFYEPDLFNSAPEGSE